MGLREVVIGFALSFTSKAFVCMVSFNMFNKKKSCIKITLTEVTLVPVSILMTFQVTVNITFSGMFCQTYFTLENVRKKCVYDEFALFIMGFYVII